MIGKPPLMSQRYEAIDALYDKLLEDEDKLFLQRQKKEAKMRKLKKKKERQEASIKGTGASVQDSSHRSSNRFDHGCEEKSDEDDDGSDDDMDGDDDDISDFIEGDEYFSEDDLNDDLLLEDLKSYHHHQNFEAELNASTADFNKEIKQINQQLLIEG